MNNSPLLNTTTRDRALLVIIASVAIIVVGILPMFVGSVAAIRNLDLAQQGWLISAESYGMLMGTILCAFIAKRCNPRTAFIVTGLVAITFNFLSIQTPSISLLLSSRFMTGCSGGLAYSLAIYYLGLIPGQERSYGVTLALQTLVFCGFAVAYPVIVKSYGAPMAVYSVGTWFIIVLLTGALLTRNLKSLNHVAAEHTATSKGTHFDGAVAMLGMLLLEMAIFSLWGYVGNVGAASGISEVDIGWAFGIGLIGGLFGAGFAAIVGNKLGRRPFISLGCAAIFAPILYMMNSQQSANTLLVALFIVNVGWMLALSYYMAHIAANDPKNFYVRYMGVTQALAAALAPTLIATIVSEGSLLPVYIVSSICAFTAAVIVYIVKKSNRAQLHQSPHNA